MNPYYIAVDGGGSKTAFCALSLETGEMHTSYAGKSNYKISETDLERMNILEGFQTLFSECGILPQQVCGLVMGMSGCDAAEDFAHYWDIALETGIAKERIYLCNDSELAFYAGGTPPGLCAIAGTGSVSTGIARDGVKARTGGWGSPISDEGSGAWIGIQALQAAIRHADGYEPYQELFDVLRESCGAQSFEELPKILSQANITDVADKAKIVMDMADAGKSAYAAKMVEKAATLVSQIAASVYRKLSFAKEAKVDVVMAGSLFKSPFFHQSFEKAFLANIATDNVAFVKEVKNPVLGGIALAEKMFP
jgi:Predicted N-acetylglucosamine kinase